jgi:CelD/BcsL family acetyltransferase involved in cellulose biosynthesis
VRYQIANNFDPRFARHSPGRILLTHDFQHAAERGVELISWGSGDAGYKSAMGAQPGPAILDLLFVRPASLALALRRLWTGSFSEARS